ncbi:hypothetical protein [Alienimonas californiensis]|uniref:Uncharacterized protein n=1 Tax=Alienimonas californiensis TaxID=2527989 RepID=A0A517PBC9_9PLAN|nr:hypothetical protein [Alienimonas californiensis]QDT16685.1 hypothetical protein CA12_27910 [Alienimonas californiensis]
MNRRHVLSAAAGAAGLVVLPAARADHHEKQGGQHGHELTGKEKADVQQMMDHIVLLNRVTEHCMTQIKQKQGKVPDHAQNHEVAMDCVPVCQTTCAFMTRESPHSQSMHRAAAECCEKTAKALEASSDTSAVVKECVKSSRECAKMCRTYL